MKLPRYRRFGNNIRLQEVWFIFGVKIPMGFVSDGATVPFIFRWLIHRFGILVYAAIFHDYCYKYALSTKAWADQHFYILGLLTNKDKKGLAQVIVRIKCWLAYWAVHFFGRGNY